jgi:hypothetical protein
VLEPVAFDGTRLGANFSRLRPPLPEFTLFGGMMVNRLDIPHLRKAGRSLRSTLLYASLLARNVEILFGTSVENLLIEQDIARSVIL